MTLGFIIAVLGLCISAFLIYNKHEVGGTILGTADIGSLVSIFVYSTKEHKKILDEQKNRLQQRSK